MESYNARTSQGFFGIPIALWIIGGLVLLYLAVNKFFCTVNYTLKRGKKVVYHGITKKYRINQRELEHIKKGKKFTLMEYEDALPRIWALYIEKNRIKRDKPIYNIQHAR